MKKIKPKESRTQYLFYYQILDVIVLIIIDSFIFFMVDKAAFLVGQLYMIPAILYLLFAKYKRQVLEIVIDEESQKIKFKINTLMFWDRILIYNLIDLSIIRKRTWLFKSYLDVLQINTKNKKIAVIPYKQSIWRKEELDLLALTLNNYILYMDLRSKH